MPPKQAKKASRAPKGPGKQCAAAAPMPRASIATVAAMLLAKRSKRSEPTFGKEFVARRGYTT